MKYHFYLKVFFGGLVDFGGATIYSLIQILSWYNLLQHEIITTRMIVEVAVDANILGLVAALLFSITRKYIKTKAANAPRNRH